MNDINIGKLSRKSNRKSKKVTDFTKRTKKKELNENAMETKNVYGFN